MSGYFTDCLADTATDATSRPELVPSASNSFAPSPLPRSERVRETALVPPGLIVVLDPTVHDDVAAHVGRPPAALARAIDRASRYW